MENLNIVIQARSRGPRTAILGWSERKDGRRWTMADQVRPASPDTSTIDLFAENSFLSRFFARTTTILETIKIIKMCFSK